MAETKIIILDFDGTLGDTASVIIKTMHETIREMGLPTRTDAECAAMIGLRLVEIPPVLFPECNIDVNLYADTYRRLFDVHNKDGAVKLYPHVIETLKALNARGLTLTIASSRGQTSLSQFVKNLGLTEIITYILGAGDVENGKPHPEAIFKTLEKYGFTPDQAIMVGDTIFDIQMGINAGTRTCGVTYGNGSRESLSPADWLIDDFSELLALACPITEE
ncbi:MAG: HAD family hydrolase [Bacteroidales bacterium]|nr:HAD family hydrolase [Bacteroidales bacterium]